MVSYKLVGRLRKVDCIIALELENQVDWVPPDFEFSLFRIFNWDYSPILL